MQHVRKLPATAAGHAEALAFLDEVCPNPRVSVIFDEIGSNIVRCSSAKEFEVSIEKGEQIVLRIADDGVAFDPTKVEPPDTSLPAEDREIGGLGLLMVRKMSKSFTYRRTPEGRNEVVVVL